MIKKIKKANEKIIIELLSDFAPEQIQFVSGNYFEHGENISFGWFEKNKLIGCIRYCIQRIGYEQKTPPLKQNGIKINEAKINIFAVNEFYRNRGIGKHLQAAVIKDAKKNNCYQVSSYSTFDKDENYAVKLKLGFCVQPEIQPDGTMGSFFLMKL